VSSPELRLPGNPEAGTPGSGALLLNSVPARLRTHPTYRAGPVFRIAGHVAADGSSELAAVAGIRAQPVAFDDWDPDPEWSARVNAGLPQLRPDWDPWQDLEESELSEDGRALDADGLPWGTADLLPFESAEESCSPTAADLEWVRQDLEVRRRALPLYDLSPEVITDKDGHPFSTLTCESCGDQSEVRLDHCGRALCLPCWRKQGRRAFPEVGRTLVAFLKLADPLLPLPAPCSRPEHRHDDAHTDLRGAGEEIRSSGERPVVRFVTLTARSGRELDPLVERILDAFGRLRSTRFWRARVRGAVMRLEVTWSPEEGWHPHLHVACVGRFLPDRPPGPFQEPRLVPRTRPLRHPPALDRLPDFYRYSYPDGAPSFLRDFEPESNLRDEWIRATRGEGSVVDVRTADVRGDPLAFAAELAKYVSKPFAGRSDGSRLELKDWPEDVRLELARFIRGATRVRWYCPAHSTLDHSATRRRAPWEISPGCPPDLSLCETEDGRRGEYRIEAVGARRLRFYGLLRLIHAETRDDLPVDLDLDRCGKCGKGQLLAPWEVARRLLAGWTLPSGAVWPLPSIQAHRSASRRWAHRSFDGAPSCSGDGTGSEGPPTGEEDLFGGRGTRADRARRELESWPGES